MLMLFGAMIMHSIFPHVHHTHNEIVSVEDHHHHHNGNEHEHSDEKVPTEQNDSKGLLDFNFSHHTHSVFNSDYTTLIVRNNKKQVDNKNLDGIYVNYIHSESILISKEKEVPPQFRNFEPKNPSFLNYSLRAPPSIV